MCDALYHRRYCVQSHLRQQAHISPHIIALVQKDPHSTGLVCDTRPLRAKSHSDRDLKAILLRIEAYELRLLVPCKAKEPFLRIEEYELRLRGV